MRMANENIIWKYYYSNIKQSNYDQSDNLTFYVSTWYYTVHNDTRKTKKHCFQ